MIKPNYKYYVATQLLPNLTFKKNTFIDISTGEEFELEDAITSSAILLDTDFVFFKESMPSSASMFFYDADSVYLGHRKLDDYNNQVMPVPEDSVSAILAFDVAEPEFADYFSRSKNVDFIYLASEVNPYFKKLSKKYAKESGQIFFRQSLDGTLKLQGKDFEKISSLSIEDSNLFIVTKYSNALKAWTSYYSGVFNKVNCEIDYAKKQCTLKLTPDDEYTRVLEHYEDSYNIIALVPEISKITLHQRSLIQVYILGSSTISNFVGGTYWETDVLEAIDSVETLRDKYHFFWSDVANEFYIGGADLDENINGTYAGTNGVYRNTNGYVCEAVQSPDSIIAYYLEIKKEGSSDVLYRSSDYLIITDTTNIYFSAEQLESVAFISQKNTQGEFAIIREKTAFRHDIFSRLLCNVPNVPDSNGSVDTYDLPVDDFATDNRNFKKVIPLNRIKIISSAKVSKEPTKYGMNDYGGYFTSKLGIIDLQSKPYPVCRSFWANASIWFVYDNFYGVFEENCRSKYQLKHSYSIAAVIKALLAKIDSSIMHEATEEYSKFLYGDANPFGYERFYIYITQKTNILKGDYDQAAQTAETSLSDIFKMLRDCFQCYWFIEDNKLKIEHIYFFVNYRTYQAGAIDYAYDLSTMLDRFNGVEAGYYQSKIAFDTNDLPARYEFSWADEVTDLFGNVKLILQNSYLQKDKKESIAITNFSSDVDYMLFNPSAFSNDGFALLCPVKKEDGTLELPIIEYPSLVDESDNSRYSALIQNYYASWIHLVNYYLWNAPGDKAVVNSLGRVYVQNVKKFASQEVNIFVDDDLNALDIIKTAYGLGSIESMSVDMLTRQFSISLLFKAK